MWYGKKVEAKQAVAPSNASFAQVEMTTVRGRLKYLPKLYLIFVSSLSLVGAGFFWGIQTTAASTKQLPPTATVAFDDLPNLAKQAYALITCAELAEYAGAPETWEILNAGIEASVWFSGST